VRVDVCFGQLGYFEPVFPLFLLVGAYQRLMRRAGARRLAAYAIVQATR